MGETVSKKRQSVDHPITSPEHRSRRKAAWKFDGDKSCPCCKNLGVNADLEEDEYHAFCGECPRTQKLHSELIADINRILSDCGVGRTLDEIYSDVSSEERSQHIFRILLADTAGKEFPDRRGSWSLAKARFEEHCLKCWSARAAMIADPESYRAACKEILVELDGLGDEAGELHRNLTEIAEGDVDIVREHLAGRQEQQADVKRSAMANQRKKKVGTSKPKKKRKERPQDTTLRIVRQLDGDELGYIERVSLPYYAIRWQPCSGPLVELQRHEFNLEEDSIEHVPDLDWIGISTTRENENVATVQGFDPPSDAFIVQFTSEVPQFWDNKMNNKRRTWHVPEHKLDRIFPERAKAGGKPGPLVYPAKG